ncbi:hypothetical protein IKE67_04750 [bacterium]|nr:hypothetical protein [bacterium]
MVQINKIANVSKVEMNPVKKTEVQQEKASSEVLQTSDDKVNYSIQSGESFMAVFDEMSSNVPDRTTTIEEKELAISYIDRMLNCDDIPDDMKTYWTDKKNVIEMEIMSIQLMSEEQNNVDNSDSAESAGTKNNSDISYKDIKEDYDDFKRKYWDKDRSFANEENKTEYWMTYDRVCMAFLDKMLKCEDLEPDMRKKYSAEYSECETDLKKLLANLNAQP